MATLEEELALRSIDKLVRPEGSVTPEDGIDQGVAVWNSDNVIIGRIDYEPIDGTLFMTKFWYVVPNVGITTEFRQLDKDTLYAWLNNDSEEYYLQNIKPIPVVE